MASFTRSSKGPDGQGEVGHVYGFSLPNRLRDLIRNDLYDHIPGPHVFTRAHPELRGRQRDLPLGLALVPAGPDEETGAGGLC